MDGLTPASADDLPPLGDLVADEPVWRYRAGGPGREEVAHLRVWLAIGPAPGYLAVVTETGLAASVTESAGHIRAALACRYGPAAVLLEHHLAPSSPRARRPWTWSASALTAACTGPASGRPQYVRPFTLWLGAACTSAA